MYGTWRGDVTVLAEEAFKWGFSLRRLQNPSGNLHLKTSSASSATPTCNWNILKFNIEHPTFIRKLFSFTSKAQPSHTSCNIPPNSGCVTINPSARQMLDNGINRKLSSTKSLSDRKLLILQTDWREAAISEKQKQIENE